MIRVYLFLAYLVAGLISWATGYLWVPLSLAGMCGFILSTFYWATERIPPAVAVASQLRPESMIDGFTLGTSLITGEPFRARLGFRHWVIGGLPDSGKSNTVGLLLSKLAPLPDVQIIGIDPKGGMEFWPWKSRMIMYADKVEQWEKMFPKLKAIMEARMLLLRKGDMVKFRPSPEMPWLVLVIDEAAEVLRLDPIAARRQRIEADLRSIISRGRALGVCVILATQKPDDTSIPTAIRDVAAVRICLQTSTGPMTDTVLGQQWRQAIADTKKIDPQFFRNTPGKATVSGMTGSVDMVQIDFFPEGKARKLAEKTAHIADDYRRTREGWFNV